MITKIACSLDRELLVYDNGPARWELMDSEGRTRAFKPEPGPQSIAEWDGTAFRTRRCVVSEVAGPFKSRMVVSGARNRYLNGDYFHILGGFKNGNGVWYIRSLAGQHVLVAKDKETLKIFGVAEEEEPMVLDLSISSSEIKTLFNKEYWAQCKKIVWMLRKQNKPLQGSPFQVSVREIPNVNNGRKSRSFIPAEM